MQTITATVSAVALLGAGGFSAARAATGSAAKPTGDKPGNGDGRATELATALGADVAKVTAILEANRPAKPVR